VLAFVPDTTPAIPGIVLTPIVGLEDLDDVELVIIIADIRLIQRRSPGTLAVLIHMVSFSHWAKRIHRNTSFLNDCHHL
jgi:hypothetical protein